MGVNMINLKENKKLTQHLFDTHCENGTGLKGTT
jgi:hypothetical protein